MHKFNYYIGIRCNGQSLQWIGVPLTDLENYVERRLIERARKKLTREVEAGYTNQSKSALVRDSETQNTAKVEFVS
jgi:hypothetical protein